MISKYDNDRTPTEACARSLRDARERRAGPSSGRRDSIVWVLELFLLAILAVMFAAFALLAMATMPAQ